MATNSMIDVESELAELSEQAVALAADILRSSRENETAAERGRSAMMARMMIDPPGKKFTIAMADQVLRISSPDRAARRMGSLVEQYGLPQFLSGLSRTGLWLGSQLASALPRTVMPLVKRQIRKESAHVIISAEEVEFAEYLARRRADRIRVNLNQLGEAVLGDAEANRRLRDNIRRLKDPGVDYISIKLSSIVSQISLVGYAQTIETIKRRLRSIYRAAVTAGSARSPKFVNLDMEEYRDLHLTLDVFRQVLDEPEFQQLEAGIVLQAYLPDSFAVQQTLTQWARQRFNRSGMGIKVRLVKGANLAMEQVEASLAGWPQAPILTKTEVDSNYKRMLEFATRPENASVVRIGVASHNLFDIALALLLRHRRGVEHRVDFEMLEGMANAQAMEVKKRSNGMTLYTPVVLDAEFESAVAYLVRRLDENTAPGSFLGALFGLTEGSPEWIQQRDAFLKACSRARHSNLAWQPNRTQNRQTDSYIVQARDEPFQNIPNTDFSLPQNREWATSIFQKWRQYQPNPVPLQVAGRELSDKLTGTGKDPSRPNLVAYQFAQADLTDVELALQTAVKAQPEWERKGILQRASVLRQAAVVFQQQRGDTIGAMLLDAGKNVSEADIEVSEAVDFANYYSRGLDDEGWHDGTQPRALGVVVVTPPWNFPYAIPAGGVMAALMAGNAVILKPARESVLTAWQLARQLWQAGVPREALQFLPTVDGATGKALVSDERVAAVILTGSIFTAPIRSIHRKWPHNWARQLWDPVLRKNPSSLQTVAA